MKSEKTKQNYSIVNIIQPYRKDSLPTDNKGLVKSDTSKIYAVTESNGFVYFREFYPEQPETDIGKQYLRVMKNDVILWSCELLRLAKVNDNGSIVAITEVETDQITLYNFKDGKVIHTINSKENITDGTDVLLTSEYLYLSVNDNDNKMMSVRQITLSNYTEAIIKLNEAGYYTLKIDKENTASVVGLKSGDVIFKLNH